MGHTVNFRTKKLYYKDKNSVHNSPEDWIIFENTQEAIVDEETRITVQKIRETKHRPKFSCFTSNKFLNILLIILIINANDIWIHRHTLSHK